MSLRAQQIVEVIRGSVRRAKPLAVLGIGNDCIVINDKHEAEMLFKKCIRGWDTSDLKYCFDALADRNCQITLKDILIGSGIDYVNWPDEPRNGDGQFDPNTGEIKKTDRARFDLAVNFSLPKVLNHYAFFKAIHDAVRRDGLICHLLMPEANPSSSPYFTIDPALFYDLARANDYDILEQSFNEAPIAASLAGNNAAKMSRGGNDRPGAGDAKSATAPIVLRRTSAAGFRFLGDPPSTADETAGDNVAERQATVNAQIQALLDRFSDPTLSVEHFHAVETAHAAADTGTPFPLLLEKRGLEIELAVHPARDHLRQRLSVVEAALQDEWPLLRIAATEGGARPPIAGDGVEQALLDMQVGAEQCDCAAAAFRQYIASGRPERFPPLLELRALCHLQRKQPDAPNWRSDLLRAAGRVSRSLASEVPQSHRRRHDTSSGPLEIICVGTGRDGTSSLSHIVAEILGPDAEVGHEYGTRELHDLFCQYRETGDDKHLVEIRRIIRECPYTCIVGNGYASVLPWFAEAYGPALKLVHLRRADRDRCISSLKENCALFPASYVYYDPGTHHGYRRLAGFHTDEMTRDTWDAKPLDEKLGWYFDKTHNIIDQHRHLFDQTIEIITEEMNSEISRRELAEFLLGAAVLVPEPALLNPHFLSVGALSEADAGSVQTILRKLNLFKLSRDGIYLLEYAADDALRRIFTVAVEEKLGDADPKRLYDLSVSVRRVGAALQSAQLKLESLRQLLQ